MLSKVLIAVVAATVFGAAVANSAGVQFRTACNSEEVIIGLAKIATQDGSALREARDAYIAAGNCFILPAYATANISRVIAGPFTDANGSDFYVVEVKSNTGASYYTFAWPGQNSDLDPGESI